MKTDVEKKNKGRVKNTKGVQKEEGGKTLVYHKRNRAITFAFSRDLHLTLCSQRSSTSGLCGIGLFLVRFCDNFFFKVRYCGFQSPSMR